LVANRGEIALRIMRTARKWEIRPLPFIQMQIGKRPLYALADEAVLWEIHPLAEILLGYWIK